MRELAEDVSFDSALIKQLFFSRLPPQVKAILAPMAEKSSVDVIASFADSDGFHKGAYYRVYSPVTG